jgi:D-alanine--poly(phosphoribitol) ligase subunit 1
MNKACIQNPFTSESSLTLDEFELISDSIAVQLQNSIAKKPIAFISSKSIQHCLHLYAAFKAGNPFYHLNPHTTFLKQVEILKLLNIKHIFTEQEHFPLFDKLKIEIPLLEMISLQKINKSEKFKPIKNKTDPCYFISTSGTTGVPKLIAINYDQLDVSLSNIQNLVQLDSSDIFLHISQLCFDVAIADFFLPLRTKCSIILIPSEQTLSGLETANKLQATVWSSSPSLFKFCAKFTPIKKITHLRKVIHCGEVFDAGLSRLWKQWAPDAELINLYGPAEATIAISGFKTSNTESAIPLGKVFKEHTFKISSDSELLIKGPQVISAYSLGDSSLDAEGFYHTGDLVEENADGEMFYKGRTDQQIKVAGMRFNISEIEHYINLSYPQIQSVVVYENETLYLIIESKEINSVTIADLKEKLIPFLPLQFIPKKLLTVEIMPLNNSGKLDRLAIKNALFPAK